jgi:hypothetical protein
MRAERAQPKSHRDDMIKALGKRSAALGQRHQMNHSPFSGFGFTGRPGKPNSEKGEAGGVGGLPRAAASAFVALQPRESAALPWAAISLPLRGARRANREPLISATYFQLRFTTPPGGGRKGRSVDHIRINPLFVQRIVPQSNAEKAGSSALRIRVDPCPSVVLLCLGTATSHANCGLRSRNPLSQNNGGTNFTTK